MLKLLVNETRMQSATLPVSWCLNDPATLLKIQKKCSKDHKPYLVISVSPEDEYHESKETRKVVALDERMTYIQFRYPGLNNIHAIVVFEESKKKAEERYLRLRSGRFSTTLLDSDGTDFLPAVVEKRKASTEYGTNTLEECGQLALTGILAKQNHCDLEGTWASKRVDVPSELFAREPSALEKAWVLWLNTNKGIDQCEFRKRRLFAYSIQPFLFLPLWVFRVLATVVLLGLICRGISLRPVFQPLTYSTGFIWGEIDSPLYWFEFGEHRWSVAVLIGLIPFLPIVAVISATITGCAMSSVPLWQAILYSIGFTYLFMVAIALVVGFLFTVSFFADGGLSDISKSIKRWLGFDENPTEEDLLELICSEDEPAPLKLDDLPRHRQTIRLRFWRTKAKVCRPFAG